MLLQFVGLFGNKLALHVLKECLFLKKSVFWLLKTIFPVIYVNSVENIQLGIFFIFFLGHSRPLFLYFRLFNTQLTENKCSLYKQILPMTGFEPRTSGIGSNRSTN